MNGIFGFFSIIILFSDFIGVFDLRLRISFSLILIAILIDGLDGIIARKIKKSEIGEYLDSMADMTSLVIAPSIFIYFIYSDVISGVNISLIYLLFALILYLGFGFIRLASFYHMKDNKYFIGLPASASTIILIVLSYLQINFIYILPIIIIIAAAMVSNIRVPKPNLKINIIATILILICLLMDKNYQGLMPWLLFISTIIYSIGSPIFIKFFKETPE
jgi:CDP-diacylglycerol--serine O-phosphatidyltransferase